MESSQRCQPCLSSASSNLNELHPKYLKAFQRKMVGNWVVDKTPESYSQKDYIGRNTWEVHKNCPSTHNPFVTLLGGTGPITTVPQQWNHRTEWMVENNYIWLAWNQNYFKLSERIQFAVHTQPHWILQHSKQDVSNRQRLRQNADMQHSAFLWTCYFGGYCKQCIV